MEPLDAGREGVGATAEARLEPLAPLIEFYTREMGALPGRLMIATSFLGDAQLTPGWSALTPEAQQLVDQAQALVVSVMVSLLNAEGACDCSSDSLRAELQRQLDGLAARE
jgi:hypothetical protein